MTKNKERSGVVTRIEDSYIEVFDNRGQEHHFVKGSLNAIKDDVKIGENVILFYRSGPAWGLWFAIKQKEEKENGD